MVGGLTGFGAVLPVCLMLFAFRIVTALGQEKRLTGSAAHLEWFWMVPVKDLLNAAVWVAAFSGNQIEWRGHRCRLLPGGKLGKMDE
jgi:hypothetical protein